MIGNDFKMPERSSEAYKVLPKEIYQCEIESIDAEMGKDFNDPDKEQLQFKVSLRVLDKGEFYGEKKLDWLVAKLSPPSKYAASKLYKFLSAVLAREITKQECDHQASVVTAELLNSLIGKQVRASISVKTVNGAQKNKIEDYMTVREQLPVLGSTGTTAAADDVPFV